MDFIKSKRFKNQFWGYFFILPGLIFFIIFVVVPLISSLFLSLYSYNSLQYKWIGFKNYIDLINDVIFHKALINTFVFVLWIVPLTMVFSLLISILILRKTEKLQSFFKASFYLSVVVSVVSISLVWNWIYNPAYGFANYLLSLIGIDPVNWLGNPKYVIASISLIVIIYSLGQPIILYTASLGALPDTYFEAAEIDGANEWQKFFKVTFPLLLPTTLYIFITTTVGAFQTFVLVHLLTGGGPNYASTTVLYLMYKTAFSYTDFGLASAMGIVLFVIVAGFSAIQFKLFSSSVEY